MNELKHNTKIKTKIIFISNENELYNIFSDENNILIVDNEVLKLELYKNLFVGLEKKIISVTNDTPIKTIQTFENIFQQLINKKVTSNMHLIGIGGGEVTDLVGFIASVYMRGIKVSFVPTTLLGIVDSSIGGKNAINLGKIKNIIGTFYHPENIYIWTDFLKTLPFMVYMSGFAEILKIAFLFDYDLMQDTLIYLNRYKGTNLNLLRLNSIIKESIKHKLKIVEQDEKDTDQRKILNFGHTIGHLLEIEYGLLHGEAVAWGMVFETKLAANLTLTDYSIYVRIRRIINKYYSSSHKAFDINKIIKNIVFDKKNIGDTIILPVVYDLGISNLKEVNLEDFRKYINAKNR